MIWHILPINDLKEHSERSSCECNPKVRQLENGDLLVSHNSYDGRELIEELLAEVNKKGEHDGL
jgi:hypothetical protein